MILSDILGIIGLPVGVLGIPLTYYFAQRGRQRPDMRSLVDHDLVISPESDILNSGLIMRFKEQEIRHVSRTNVALWNKQGDTVRGSDIVPDDPLRVTVGAGGVILQARIVALSRPQIKPSVSIPDTDSSILRVDFDFLDQCDGFVIEILHESEYEPQIEGTLRGAVIKPEPWAPIPSGELSFIAEARWYRRLFRSRFIIFTPYLFLFIGLTSYSSADIIFRSPVLVDPKGYQLDTLAGQAEYAGAVKDAGQPELAFSIATYGLVALVLIGAAVFALAVRREVKSLLPKSVLQVRPYEERPEEETDD